MRTFIVKFYQAYVDEHQFFGLDEDLYKLVSNIVLSHSETYRIVLALLRIQYYNADKDMRLKYQKLRKATPQHFGIDNYFTLNDESLILSELSTKHPAFRRTSIENYEPMSV